MASFLGIFTMRNLLVLSLALNLSLGPRVVYEGGKDGGPHGFSVQEQRAPSMADMGFGKSAQATQRTRLSVSSSSDQDVMERVINLDQMVVIWAPHDWPVECLVPLAVSCKDNKVLALDDLEYIHYNAKTINLTSSQDKRFMLRQKIRVSNSANQHKCPARSQGREIFSSSCNALPIVTDDIAVTKRILGVPIKHGARVSQKDKLATVSANQHKCPARSQGRKIFSSSCNALPIITDNIGVTKRNLRLPIKHGARVSQKDKFSMLLNKTSVSHCANQHKCPACLQGREIFSGSCNALPIVTDGDTITERTLWLIKQRARLCQKNKMGITFLIMITMLGWIPGVKAAEKNASALVQGSTTTSTVVCVVIGTVASLYFSYKFLKWFRLPPPDWTIFSRKVRIRTEGYMEFAEMHFELFDEEDKCVGSWNCSYFTEHEDGVDMVDMVSWVTQLFNMMLHIFVEQEGGEEEISFNEMDHPDFINTAKEVYFLNPDTGLLHYIGRSPPRNDLPGELGILSKRIADADADRLGVYSGNYQVSHLQAS